MLKIYWNQFYLFFLIGYLTFRSTLRLLQSCALVMNLRVEPTTSASIAHWAAPATNSFYYLLPVWFGRPTKLSLQFVVHSIIYFRILFRVDINMPAKKYLSVRSIYLSVHPYQINTINNFCSIIFLKFMPFYKLHCYLLSN